MKKIKIDVGWGRLPRLIIKKLAGLKLGEYENRVVWAITYFTIGYSRYDDWIAQSQITEMTGIRQQHLDRTIKSLLKKGVIHKKDVRYRLVIEFDIIENRYGKEYNKKYTWTGEKYTCGGVKYTPGEVDSKDSSKDYTPKKGILEVKMKRKEIDKLEGKPWLRATMINQGSFDINFIDEILKKHPFMKLYDCWDQLQEASNVYDRKAWFLAKLNNWVDPERDN